jgi:hypothetical protein
MRSTLTSVMKIKCITYTCIKFKIRTALIHLIFMTLINVERSPNLKLYTFVCNTLNLHDTEIERSPNLEIYTLLSVLHTNV